VEHKLKKKQIHNTKMEHKLQN